ncbi:bifunctional metallophosphatase/5'-nucleotidase [Fervidibacillus albus]|uniref:Bifunctional metallophosphatase/5'-nucleotidase n=1 Tax=Fervidibacillus albus TaxID=2980026 RepID=A0A9E8LUK0_9BACI|nr:bifunctional UDP-sugar hydrolase/5'-nucleotidase [Fervidibacillus albus]WAA09942.1 bifunctional metallophosphatase/5'-nucleotidase [Fervidibacillus albus]
MENIYIYHTNDLHSHFQKWPRIQAEVLRRREMHENRGETMFLFDIGDHIDRFHPFTEATRGKGNVDLLNDSKYDAVTIGNNEGITLSKEELMSLYGGAKFDCIVANIFNEDGTRPDWAEPFKIYETHNRTKIGVIGVTIPYTNFYGPLRWKATDPFETLKHWIPIVANEVDILIVLSHLGLSDDERIANEFPVVDVVLGAHTHHVLEKGKEMNRSLLACTGKYGDHLGIVKLTYDRKKHHFFKKEAKLIRTEDLPIVDDEKGFDERLFQQGKNMLQNPVARLPERLESNWFQETKLNRLLCEGLTEWCRADCSFLNAGILIDDLPKGIVTEYDIHRICPHPINPCTLRLSGAELKEVLVQTVEEKYTTLKFKGFGFRGEIFGTMIYDQITMDGKGSAMDIKIRGKRLDPEKVYLVATIDMFAFAKFFPQLLRAEKTFFLPEFLRDVLKWKVQSIYPYLKDDGEDGTVSHRYEH